MVDLTKDVEDLTGIDSVEFVTSWRGGGGPFGVNVDSSLVYYSRGEPFGVAEPRKGSDKALSGRLHHVSGDVKKGQEGEDAGERIVADLAGIRDEDQDVDGLALILSCRRGDFGKISEGVSRIYDTTGGERRHLGNCRIPLSKGVSGAVACVLRKTPGGVWQYVAVPQGQGRGTARDWRGVGGMASHLVGR